jgi:hypothetical protein
MQKIHIKPEEMLSLWRKIAYSPPGKVLSPRQICEISAGDEEV